MGAARVLVLVLAVAALANGRNLVQSNDEKALMEAEKLVEDMLNKGLISKEQDLPMFAESEQDTGDEYGDSEDYEEYDAEEEDYDEEDSDADIEDDEDDYGGIEDYDEEYADTEEEDGDDYGGIEDYGDDTSSVQGANGRNEEDINEREGVADKMFEGDIALTKRQKSIIGGQLEKLSDKLATEEAWVKNLGVKKWRNGVVPYVLDKSLTKKTRRVIRSAMKYMRKKSGGCITFKKRKNQKDYIQFISEDGCWSEIGRIGGKQEISIENGGCDTKGIVSHEIFHALGRWHEQSRPDRDNWVDIKWRNVKKGKSFRSQFKKRPKSKKQGIRYDYGSIMHYGPASFSKNGKPTIKARCPDGQKQMGQRKRLSKYDVKHLKKAYKCKRRRG